MSSVYKKPSCDDLFGTASFGGGSRPRYPRPVTQKPSSHYSQNGLDLNGNGSILDETAAVAAITAAAMTGGAVGVIGAIGAAAGYGTASGY